MPSSVPRLLANCPRTYYLDEASLNDPLTDAPSVLHMQRQASSIRPALALSNIPRAKICRVRELLVGYIVDCDLPFTVFESEYIRELFRQLDPDLAA
jgi:hypothetical protein